MFEKSRAERIRVPTDSVWRGCRQWLNRPLACGLRKCGRQRANEFILRLPRTPKWKSWVKRVVVGENRNFRGNIDFLRSQGVDVRLMHDADCIALMKRFIQEHPDLRDEDIAGQQGV